MCIVCCCTHTGTVHTVVFCCQDFGDGGAYPELHVAQFPMGLGQQKSKGGASSSNALAKQVDADGKIKYDVIARYGHAQDKVNRH